jgi:hypothetical protein
VVAPSSRDRRVHPDLARRWRDAEGLLDDLLERLGAGRGTSTFEIGLWPVSTPDPRAFIDNLTHEVADDGTWSFVVTGENTQTGESLVLAMPVTRTGPETGLVIPLADLHTRMCAWLLSYAWRTSQLAVASGSLADDGLPLPSAALVRPLVETVAALYADARKVAKAWDNLKRGGTPRLGESDLWAGRNALLEVLQEITWGSKFDGDRAPDDAAVWKQSRTNVMGQVDRLAKATDMALPSLYQWLCNTVHPSLGTTYLFGGPILGHKSRTHYQRYWADSGVHVENLRTGAQTREDKVETAIAQVAVLSLEAFCAAWDAAVRIVDDFALTTRSCEVIREEYWRKLIRGERNSPCPCRSGSKSKHCEHRWGDHGPEMPSDLGVRLGAT